MMQMDLYQAKPQKTVPLGEEAFENQEGTNVYWLGSAGVLINCRGTTIMIDPVLSSLPGEPDMSEMYGKRFLTAPPIQPEQVKKLDAVLYTHADEDHMGPLTAKGLLDSGAVYHTTPFAAEALRNLGIPRERICEHTHHSVFYIGGVRVRMTGAFHPHQLGNPLGNRGWYFGVEDCTGYRLETQDGIIWDPGDSILMEEHLRNRDADLVFMDFSDNEHHFGRRLAIQLANALSRSELIMFHWGTAYAPENDSFNSDPKMVAPHIIPSERLHVLNPGEAWRL